MSGAPAECPNCGTTVIDRYCPHCGQEYADSIPSLRRMIADLVDDQFTLNGSLPRTLFALLARPGHLTREYSAGRVARYIRPFRLFLVSSVIFFVALATVADPDRMMSEVEQRVGDVEEIQAEGEFKTVDIGLEPEDLPRWAHPMLRRLDATESRLNALPPREALRLMVSATLETLPKLAFVLVPVLALLLLALHYRRHPRYVEHFVFALHYQAMAFLLLTPLLIVGTTVGRALVMSWLAVYLLVALRNAYGQPWWLAGIKFVAIGVIYPTILALGLAVAFVTALLVV